LLFNIAMKSLVFQCLLISNKILLLISTYSLLIFSLFSFINYRTFCYHPPTWGSTISIIMFRPVNPQQKKSLLIKVSKKQCAITRSLKDCCLQANLLITIDRLDISQSNFFVFSTKQILRILNDGLGCFPFD